MAQQSKPGAEALQRIVLDAWHGRTATDPARVANAQAALETTVYVALRSDGHKLASAWATEVDLNRAVFSAVESARLGLPDGPDPDTVELCVVDGREDVAWSDRGKKFSLLRRGIVGAEIVLGDDKTRIAPTEIIASNERYSKFFKDFLEKHGLSETVASERVRLTRLDVRQFLIPLSEGGKPIQMFRGSETVPQAGVTKNAVAGFAERMSSWMFNNLMPDGRMLYKYWPSKDEESSANNTIRQWMASVCLVRIAKFYGDTEMTARAHANIAFNLEAFQTTRDGFASIEYGGSSKLGAISLAALALSESRTSEDDDRIESEFRKTIHHLWQGDGSFRTFLWPKNRNDNQNFYPGEALLYLAHLYKASGDEDLGRKIQKGAEYYRTWHLANRNPAFVPWHTMAYCLFLERQFDPLLADWVFEMNDWLLSMQQTAPEGFPDIDGRFYDPKRPKFGVPHASSTGVYLEGLLSALKLARQTNDETRAEAFRRSIVRGLRSLMQLEFSSDADMFYISRRERVYGGLRTTVYNNEIRVDNVQHGLMAILRILEEFSDEDFAINRD